jgi:metal-responsive CopG/Arc/MetJ family transcriptional regulator
MPKRPGESTSKYSESTLLRLEVGTIARIDDVLERFEERSHMLREAIEREIERRKRNSEKK